MPPHRQPSISTHVLDNERGLPAVGVRVTLERRDGDAFTTLASATTDADGRIASLLPGQLQAGAYRIAFDYAIFSHKLLSSLYPPNTILLRKGCFTVSDRGHTEAWTVTGPVAVLSARITHDDWKPTSLWLTGQARYTLDVGLN